MSEPDAAVQDFYPDDTAHCYGCGRLNAEGHRLRTRWDGDETVARFTPEPHHTAIPGYVYGGLIASLVDCHGTGTAALAALRAEGRELPSADDAGPAEVEVPRFVTGRLTVDFVKPTPLGPEIEVRGSVKEIAERKVVVEATVSAAGEVCARGEVVAVRMPESMIRAR